MLTLLGIAVLPSGLDWVDTSESEESTSSRDKNIRINRGKKRIYLEGKMLL